MKEAIVLILLVILTGCVTEFNSNKYKGYRVVDNHVLYNDGFYTAQPGFLMEKNGVFKTVLVPEGLRIEYKNGDTIK